jgi:hypothetical protein
LGCAQLEGRDDDEWSRESGRFLDYQTFAAEMISSAMVVISDCRLGRYPKDRFLSISIMAFLAFALPMPAITVENVGALRSYSLGSPDTGATIQTAGYYSAGDGGGATFVYNPQSSAPDNGGTVIGPSRGLGRWILQPNGPIRAEWFGAVSGADYGAAISAAIASLGANGGTITVDYNPVGIATTPVNLTNTTNGITIQGNGGSHNLPVFTVAHKGVGIDCTGSNNVTFRNFFIRGSSITVPKVGFLLARNATGNSAEKNRFFNSGTSGLSRFSVAALYNYGSECDEYYGCTFDNDYAAAKVAVWTANNILGVSGNFVKIATQSQSCTVHNIFGGVWYTLGGAGSRVFSLDEINDFHMWGGFMRNDSGAGMGGDAMVYYYSVNGASMINSYEGIRCEIGDARPNYGFYFDSLTARTFQFFTVENCTIDANRSPCYAGDKATLDAWHYQGNWDVQNSGLNAYRIFNSEFTMDYGSRFAIRPGGSLCSSRIVGIAANTVIPAENAIGASFYDTATSRTTNYPTRAGGGGLVGMPSGVAPIPGVVGETVVGSLPAELAHRLESGTATALFGIRIPSAGNWRLSATVYFVNGSRTTSRFMLANLSSTANSFGIEDGSRASCVGCTGNQVDLSVSVNLPRVIVTNGAVTYYLNVAAYFKGGPCSAFGFGSAVRAY